MSRAEIYAAWLACDTAFSTELARVYGAKAGDARYDRARTTATPLLDTLAEAFDALRRAWELTKPVQS